MSADEVLVVLGGIGAIAWVNWYFLVQGRRKREEGDRGGGDGASGEGTP